MDCYICKEVLFLVIINIVLQFSNSVPVSNIQETTLNDLNGKKLMAIGKKLNLPKLQMIGKTIETAKNELEAQMNAIIEEKLETKICAHHPCSDWTEWSRCTPLVGQFGSHFRTRRCSINMTTCEVDSNSKTEKEFGICIWFCPEGYNLTKNGFCLKYYGDKGEGANQEYAEKHCQKDGGRLVNIDSEVKYEDVSKLKGFSKIGIWIDGRRKDVGSPWEYNNGSQIGFFKWNRGQPNNRSDELCLSLVFYKNILKFHDAKCTSLYYPICEIVKIV